jgi:hypothetical protein
MVWVGAIVPLNILPISPVTIGRPVIPGQMPSLITDKHFACQIGIPDLRRGGIRHPQTDTWHHGSTQPAAHRQMSNHCGTAQVEIQAIMGH